MNKLIKFDCPACEVFMKRYRASGYICPICKSIFLPSEEAIRDQLNKLKQHARIDELNKVIPKSLDEKIIDKVHSLMD